MSQALSNNGCTRLRRTISVWEDIVAAHYSKRINHLSAGSGFQLAAKLQSFHPARILCYAIIVMLGVHVSLSHSQSQEEIDKGNYMVLLIADMAFSKCNDSYKASKGQKERTSSQLLSAARKVYGVNAEPELHRGACQDSCRLSHAANG